ncbi:MAG TPA: D-glycero-beta-D-manno-heptose-1,7-bisphosphate 7-phosphatase [Desulfobacteraceae bacterium]|nr:D-glycero-beta-D-manno-heptose-1,7-bisphosphate 7-phosphatase [Desulfobacteraceae bacterium]
MGLKKVVFLDRDGVINKNSPNYIKSWSEFNFIQGSLEAIALLNSNKFSTIVITNQSAINRNMISEKGLAHIHFMMKQAIEESGGLIKEIFYCPHTPDNGCNCRKPMPGLINRAEKLYDIDLADSVMVGDSAKDIQCAQNAGCGKTVLVKTGDYNNAIRILSEKNISPSYIAKDLYNAVRWIINL